MKDDRIYLMHILECIRRIEQQRDAGVDEFMSSTTSQDAVLRNLQVMAESTQRLSSELKEAEPGIPWVEISGFRNILVHDYLGIDMEIIWGIMQEEVIELKMAVERLSARDLSDDE